MREVVVFSLVPDGMPFRDIAFAVAEFHALPADIVWELHQNRQVDQIRELGSGGVGAVQNDDRGRVCGNRVRGQTFKSFPVEWVPDGLPVGDPYWFTGTTTRVASNVAATPHTFSLSEAYPNPFNPSTNVQYSLPASGAVSLKVYNVLGQLVKTLVDNAHQEAGTYTVRVDMSNVTSGVYFYSLEQGNNRLVHKMMLLK